MYYKKKQKANLKAAKHTLGVFKTTVCCDIGKGSKYGVFSHLLGSFEEKPQMGGGNSGNAHLMVQEVEERKRGP